VTSVQYTCEVIWRARSGRGRGSCSAMSHNRLSEPIRTLDIEFQPDIHGIGMTSAGSNPNLSVVCPDLCVKRKQMLQTGLSRTPRFRLHTFQCRTREHQPQVALPPPKRVGTPIFGDLSPHKVLAFSELLSTWQPVNACVPVDDHTYYTLAAARSMSNVGLPSLQLDPRCKCV